MDKLSLIEPLWLHRAVMLSGFIALLTVLSCPPAFSEARIPVLSLSDAIASVQPISDMQFEALAQEPEDLEFIPASALSFEYSGRIDFKNPEAPVIIWQGTEIRATFSGTRLAVRFAGPTGRNFFNVIVDGKIAMLQLEGSGEYDYALKTPLAPGRHELSIFKRTEAMYGTAAFKGLMVEKGAALGPKPASRPVKIEFYGDSITAGACDEDPNLDQYEDLSVHNTYTSYGAIVARDLNAEYSNISYSGIGICISWHPLVMPEVWNKLYPEAASPAYDFSARTPDIVVINLGQNDFGVTQDQKIPFPKNFTEQYTRLLADIRARYPASWIVCATGGMGAIRSSRELGRQWNAAMRNFAADPKILQMTFKAYTDNHPRVDTHIKLARELESFLVSKIPGLALR